MYIPLAAGLVAIQNQANNVDSSNVDAMGFRAGGKREYSMESLRSHEKFLRMLQHAIVEVLKRTFTSIPILDQMQLFGMTFGKR